MPSVLDLWHVGPGAGTNKMADSRSPPDQRRTRGQTPHRQWERGGGGRPQRQKESTDVGGEDGVLNADVYKPLNDV